MAAIARPHSRGDHQVVELDLTTADSKEVRVDRPSVKNQKGDFGEYDTNILLLFGGLPNRSNDLRGAQEPWLRPDTVVA
jgi:hypothetical protein